MAINFSSNYRALSAKVDEFLNSALERRQSGALGEVLHYTVAAPGKRLRPVLAISVAAIADLPVEKVRSFAVALEFIHTSTLIHDDLPALDNDSLRRGQPTAHIIYGEAAALLAGDLLICEAAKEILQDSSLPALARVELADLLFTATGEVCHGQMLDLQAVRSASAAPEQLYERHRKKTAELIIAAVSGPLLLAESRISQALKPALVRFGESLGLLFQVTDDILDASGVTEVLGKTAGSDIDRQASTFVSIYGLEKARELAAEKAREAHEALSPLGDKALFLRAFVDYVLEREK